jgi:hypothetical protein
MKKVMEVVIPVATMTGAVIIGLWIWEGYLRAKLITPVVAPAPTATTTT